MTPLRIGPASIDMAEYAIAGNAILGIRDSGKSYSATLFAEELHERGVPFVAFDPIGVWRFLRVPGPGRTGKGYPVVVAGGEDGDLPLSVAGAPEILRAAMEGGVSLVIDLFDRRLSKADWRRIVTGCAEVLLHENRRFGLRHVFLEEAPEFVPQRIGPEAGRAYDAIERLARMGGNSGVGLTLIGQRSAEINKAVLELCDSLSLHRQTGRNSLDHLEKWLKAGAVTDGRAVMDTLATLPTGECWAWLAHSDQPVRLKMPAKRSLHPDRRSRSGSIRTAQKTVDVGSFVASMSAALTSIEEEAKAGDPVRLKARIAELEKKPAADTSAADRAREEGYDAGYREGRRDEASTSMRHYVAALDSIRVSAERAIQIGRERAAKIEGKNLVVPSKPRRPAFASVDTMKAIESAPPARVPRPAGNLKSGLKLGKGERAVLTAIAQHGGNDGASREQLTVLTGYKRSARDTYIQRLRAAGLIEERGARLFATGTGLDGLGDWERLPTGSALRQWWLERLPAGERRILDLVCEFTAAAGRPAAREHLGESSGYKRSALNSYIQRLGARRLVETGPDGVRASPLLFD